MSYTMTQIRQALVAGAQVEWERPVKDFHAGQEATSDLIHRYWRACGWQWFLDEYSDGTYTEQWQDGPMQSWCGLFVGYLLTHVGDWLEANRCVNVTVQRRIVTEIMPSTDRLYAHRSEFDQPGVSQLRAGDWITTGDAKDGSHIRLVRQSVSGDDDTVLTYEGNGTGELGDGTTGEGVARDEVSLDAIKQAYRLRREHVVGADAPSPM